MRAVLLTGHGGVEMLQVRNDVPVPQPQPGEVLIEVGACGVNNTDVNTRIRWYGRGTNTTVSEDVGLKGIDDQAGPSAEAPASWQQDHVGFPLIQGGAVVGTIASVGDAGPTERVGQRVIVDSQVRDRALPARAQLTAYIGTDRDGGFAEFVAVPSTNAHQITSDLSDAELATFPCSYDTAEEMLTRARLSAGETIVITGAAGGVGTALLQLSRIRGAQVIAVAGAQKKEQILAIGADHFIARESGDLESAVAAIANAAGVDVVADVVGGSMFGSLLKILRRGGRYAGAGAIGGPVQPMDLRDLIYKDLEMYGITCPPPETFATVVSYIESGQLRPLLQRSFPLDQVAAAQAELVKRTHVGKFVVTL